MDFMMGGIIQFGGTYAPKGWAFCDGHLLDINQNSALFAILGTIYGGDGRTSFGLPDLRGRIPIGVGSGPGLTQVFQGYPTGSEFQRLQSQQMPLHSHNATFSGTGGSTGTAISATVTVKAKVGLGDQDNAGGDGKYWATGQGVDGRNLHPVEKGYSSTADTTMASDAVTVDITGGGGITGGTVAIGQTGGGQPFSIMQPALGMQFILALEGIFPSRN